MNTFRYVTDQEKGVYIVCSDKALLDKINRMLKRQGIIGITDGEGRLHYMIDARKSQSSAARKVNDFINTVKSNTITGNKAYVPEELSDEILEETIDSVMEFYHLDKSMQGTKVLRYLVRYYIYIGTFENRNMKEIYSSICFDLNSSYQQMERNVRYALSKSKFSGMKIKTIRVIYILADAVKIGLESQHLKIVQKNTK